MENISLSIPCLVLSTETDISGEIEKHILTPFGYIDVIFPNIFNQNNENTPLEIKLIGDIDSWMLGESMPVEFRTTLRKFIVEMVQMCTGSFLPKSTQNSIRLKGENQVIKVLLTK